jgi:cytochrome d ubiquinol oxidase subunit II
MGLQEAPLVLLLLGLVAYAVLAGADFGAGLWQLTAGAGEWGERIRDHAHRSLAPVWEANHVWLIFILVVAWTAYPEAFGSIGSTLAIPLFVAAVGIILLGISYTLREGVKSPRERRRVDTAFAMSAILTPFALGAAVGGIASRRVPVGNAAGDPVDSWLNPTSVLVGQLTVAAGAYLAAVYLAADATRLGDRDLARAFRSRALGAGVVAGGLAVAGPFVLRLDARALYDDLVAGDGLPLLVVSATAGIVTLGLVWRWRFEAARYAAAVAVGAIVAGWAVAQSPVLLPGLTVSQAAAPDSTIIALLVAAAAGSVILFPSLVLLFRMVLTGRFDRPAATPVAPIASPVRVPGGLGRLAAASLIAGIAFLNIAQAGWAHAVGVVCLIAFVALGVAAVLRQIDVLSHD